jgi:hypothetical protein|tara:strand:+ start:231 stop:560 length:330 start_codon:yes stop_codon:yes gene_type:complete
MTIKIIGLVKDYPGKLFIEIPVDLRDEAKLSHGDILQGDFNKIIYSKGKTKKINEKVAWEVGEFNNMLIVPREIIENHEINPGGLFEEGGSLQLTIKKVKKKDGITLDI